jgi:hypothetical protein
MGMAYSTNGGEEECLYVLYVFMFSHNNIKLDVREIGWYGMDWIDLAQDRDQWRALVDMVTNLRVP